MVTLIFGTAVTDIDTESAIRVFSATRRTVEAKPPIRTFFKKKIDMVIGMQIKKTALNICLIIS